MRVRCDYCGNYIEDTDKNCPHCGAPNDRMQRSGTKVPKTIEELKAFCAAHHLPLEQMRFFLGEDYRGPRAFGVYKDGEGNFVVYKNKSDGSRAVRYRGTDEAYAVNELYQKMKSEISNQRARQGKGGGTQSKSKGSSRSLIAILLAVYLGINIVPKLVRRFTPEPPPTGYYTYEDTYYYNQHDDWYYYDTDFGSWTPTEVPATLGDNYAQYFESSSYTGSEAPADFSESAYYVEPDYDEDWDDDDWDWGSSDSWDSGSTDWDSDW